MRKWATDKGYFANTCRFDISDEPSTPSHEAFIFFPWQPCADPLIIFVHNGLIGGLRRGFKLRQDDRIGVIAHTGAEAEIRTKVPIGHDLLAIIVAQHPLAAFVAKD